MGTLITLKQVHELGVSWYFPGLSDNQKITFPVGEYKHQVAILNETLSNTYGLKVDIRKFIQESINCTVIMSVTGRAYRHYYPWSMEKTRWDWDSTIVDWQFTTFNFSNEHDALLFKMRFSEVVRDVTPYDPERPPTELQEAEHECREAERRLQKSKKHLSNMKVIYTGNGGEDYEGHINMDEETFRRLTDVISDEYDDTIFVDNNNDKTFRCEALSTALKNAVRVNDKKALLARVLKRLHEN